MKIVAIRERAVSIASPMRNAYVNFAHLTASIVAVVTDVIRDGAPVVGYGFKQTAALPARLTAASTGGTKNE